VRWVVRDANFDEVNEPNGSAKSSGITLLDRYLDTNYRQVASSGKVAIWLANGETPVAIRPGGKCIARKLMIVGLGLSDRYVGPHLCARSCFMI
jgi:hypothetical protein